MIAFFTLNNNETQHLACLIIHFDDFSLIFPIWFTFNYTTKGLYFLIYFSSFLFSVKRTDNRKFRIKYQNFIDPFICLFFLHEPFSRFVFSMLNLRARMQQYFIETLWRKVERKREWHGPLRWLLKNKKKVCPRNNVVVAANGEVKLACWTIIHFIPFIRFSKCKRAEYQYCSDIVIIPFPTAELTAHRRNARINHHFPVSRRIKF